MSELMRHLLRNYVVLRAGEGDTYLNTEYLIIWKSIGFGYIIIMSSIISIDRQLNTDDEWTNVYYVYEMISS